VVGGGCVGLCALGMARVAGATMVIVSELLEYRRELAKSLGADIVIDPAKEDVVEVVRAQTEGRGADVSFEAAGAPDTYQTCVDATRAGGTPVFIGIPEGDTISLCIHNARRKGLTIKNLRRFVHTYDRAIRLLEAGAFDAKKLVTHTFPLEKTREALEVAGSYADGVLKAEVRI